MSTTFTQPPQSTVQYPDDDGQPMAENTLQFKWIVLIKEGLETLFRHDPNVFVAGDLLWYPEEGKPKIRQAPDGMVVLGRPKGRRGSYKQWEEDGIAPHVVFEVLSQGTGSMSCSGSSGSTRSMGLRNTTSTTRTTATCSAGGAAMSAWKRSPR